MMNRKEFLDELAFLLQDIEDVERDEAIQYYQDYFDEAGIENEQQVINELGTPEKVAAIIKAGINENLLMLSSTCIKEDIELLIKNHVILTVGSEEAVKCVNEIAQKLGKKVRVHLKIDTGFGRYGFIYSERDKMIEALKSAENLKIEGTYTHFSISFFDDKYTKLQFQRFIDCIEVLKMNKIKLK